MPLKGNFDLIESIAGVPVLIDVDEETGELERKSFRRRGREGGGSPEGGGGYEVVIARCTALILVDSPYRCNCRCGSQILFVPYTFRIARKLTS